MLSAQERFSSLNMRTARGTERYASKDDTLDKPEDRLNEDENIEGRGLLAKDKELIQNEDEASEEEHEIQESELEAKRRMNVTVTVVNDSKRQKILEAIQKLVLQKVDAGRQSDRERMKEIEEEIDNLESQL